MNLSKILIFQAAVLCGALPLAVHGASAEYEPIKINQTDSPVFPRNLVMVGIKSGVASIAVAVDDEGKMTDFLVTAYTHPAFAETALKSLKKWTFEPARVRGAPRNSKVDLTFNFEVEGVVVVSMTPLTYAELLRFKIAPNSMTYSACTLAQLDRIPTPKKIVNPIYPNQVARSSRGGHVSVEFYIDEQGHVRMPSVSRETDMANEELSGIAVTTVAQWEFEPPMCKGRPVLVRAQQDFDFKPAKPQ
jgi:TonB family protein